MHIFVCRIIAMVTKKDYPFAWLLFSRPSPISFYRRDLFSSLLSTTAKMCHIVITHHYYYVLLLTTCDCISLHSIQLYQNNVCIRPHMLFIRVDYYIMERWRWRHFQHYYIHHSSCNICIYEYLEVMATSVHNFVYAIWSRSYIHIHMHEYNDKGIDESGINLWFCWLKM